MSPPFVFKHLIRTCSIIRSEERPADKPSLLLMHENLDRNVGKQKDAHSLGQPSAALRDYSVSKSSMFSVS